MFNIEIALCVLLTIVLVVHGYVHVKGCKYVKLDGIFDSYKYGDVKIDVINHGYAIKELKEEVGELKSLLKGVANKKEKALTLEEDK